MKTAKKSSGKRKNATIINPVGDFLYIRVNLVCTIEKEKADMYSSHCVALDLYSQGDSEEEAKRNLDDAIRGFIETCIEMGTLAEVLADAGFSASHGQKEKKANGKKTKIPAFFPTSAFPIQLCGLAMNKKCCSDTLQR